MRNVLLIMLCVVSSDLHAGFRIVDEYYSDATSYVEIIDEDTEEEFELYIDYVDENTHILYYSPGYPALDDSNLKGCNAKPLIEMENIITANSYASGANISQWHARHLLGLEKCVYADDIKYYQVVELMLLGMIAGSITLRIMLYSGKSRGWFI